jgi:DNA-binding NarL/FixJ family response regulator
MSKVRVLLADDHETTLEWVRIALSDEFDVVGAVRNGRDVVTEVRRLDPDVLVIDISMPILDGLQAVAQLDSSHRTAVVFLTLHTDPDFVTAAFNVGASAYVAKSDLNSDLVPAIHKALRGGRYVSRSIRST